MKKRKKKLEEQYKEKTEASKAKIKKEIEEEYESISKKENSKNDEIIADLNSDIDKLQKELDKLKEENESTLNTNNNFNIND